MVHRWFTALSKPGSSPFLNRYRVITGICFIVAALLVLFSPLQMPDPDDWAYYNGVRNFAEGRLTVDNVTIYQQTWEITEQGGWLIQYLPIGYNRWALEKAPGVVFYLVPFEKIGFPRLGAVFLALGTVIVTYLLLTRLHGERAAMFGSLLILFTPIALVMYNRIYMDTYASMAFLSIGGGLYLFYHLERSQLSVKKGGLLLFLAFFFVGWSVVTRYTNLPVAVMIALHMVVVRLIEYRTMKLSGIGKEIVPLVLGIGLPVAVLLFYDYYVFGSLFVYGYALTPYPVKFAFQYLGQVDANGESIVRQILLYNLEGFMRNLWTGFPLLAIGIPGFAVILYRKTAALFARRFPGELASILSWDILLLLVFWFAGVFGLYLGYEWTAGLQKGGGFVIFDRFLLPGLFPVVVVVALVLARFSLKVSVPLITVLVIFGGLVYAQWALDVHIFPESMMERTLETRWTGYIFPPWTDSAFNP